MWSWGYYTDDHRLVAHHVVCQTVVTERYLFQGKCSHGGILDSGRHQEAQGGINKDSTSPFFSPHHYLHAEAAKLATMATLMVLRDLRDTVGPKNFLRSGNTSLECFVRIHIKQKQTLDKV